jgi:hypothetical protein
MAGRVERQLRSDILSDDSFRAFFEAECNKRGMSLDEGIRRATLELREYAASSQGQSEILNGFDDDHITMIQEQSELAGLPLNEYLQQILFESEERLDDIDARIRDSISRDIDDFRRWLDES